MVSIWLASQSPRRTAMIKELFPNAHCEGLQGVDETPMSSGTVAEKVESICQAKAHAIPEDHGYDVVLVCDTVLADPDEVNALLGNHEILFMLPRCFTDSPAAATKYGPRPDFAFTGIGGFLPNFPL